MPTEAGADGSLCYSVVGGVNEANPLCFSPSILPSSDGIKEGNNSMSGSFGKRRKSRAQSSCSHPTNAKEKKRIIKKERNFHLYPITYSPLLL